MSWRDKLQQASYKNTPFEVETMSRSGGKRGTSHEFIDNGVPYFEERGKKTGEFPFEAFVIGEDYLEKRDALIQAIESVGSGELIHPTYGSIEANCLSFSVTEGISEGMGWAKFSFTFIKSGGISQPIASIPKRLFLQDVIDGLREVVDLELSEKFDVVGFPSYVVSEAKETMTAMTDQIDRITNSVRSQVQDVAIFKSNLKKLKNSFEEIVSAPKTLVDEYSKIYSSMSSLFSDKKSISEKALIAASNIIASEVKASESVVTIGENQVVKNKKNLSSFEKRHLVLLSVESLVKSVFETNQEQAIDDVLSSNSFLTIEDVVEFKEKLIAEIDALLSDKSTSHEIYEKFYKLKSDLSLSIPAEINRLPSKRSISLVEVKPSLLVVYNEFGQVNKEREFSLINNIENPLFVPAGKSLEVIGDV